MTTFSERRDAAIRSYAVREGIPFDTAVERLVGYGLNAVAEHDRYLESLKPRPYRIESSRTYTDADGETALADYVEIDALPAIEDAREVLCGIVDADEAAKAAIEAAPLGHALALGGEYYRITKSS
jgi:hypothetical protein